MQAHAGVVSAATVGAGATAALLFGFVAFSLRRKGGEDPAAELARAIRNGELVPYYQPIVDLTDARVVSAEVLVRWRKSDGTLVPPVRFIPLAESSGLIVELTRALMRRVCAEAGAEIGKRPHFRSASICRRGTSPTRRSSRTSARFSPARRSRRARCCSRSPSARRSTISQSRAV